LTPQTPDSLLALIVQSLDDDQAIDITKLDLKGKTSIADYMVIASGTSNRHVGAMTDHLLRRIKSGGIKGTSVEGAAQADWVLIDAGDVLVHLFRPEVREFYKLEKLWGDFPTQGDNQLSTAAG
jgi:ribosome-associated protein